MGIVDGIKKALTGFSDKRKMRVLSDTFSIINGYSPVFQTFSAGIYEMDLTRSAIHALATHTSKLNPIIIGGGYKSLEKILQIKPNSIMTSQQFLYRLRTIYEVENNAYIIPIYSDDTATKIVGLYPVSTVGSELVNVDGKIYLKYNLGNRRKAIEYERIGHLKKHQYTSEYFGSSHSALNSTIELLSTQNEGIINGVKQAANIRFLAQLSTVLLPKDLETERKRLVTENLSAENNGGVFMYDNKYKNIQQIDSKPWVIDDKQSELVKKNVFNYFGVNEAILSNSFKEDEWNAFYEGAIESFAIQLSQVISAMLYIDEELRKGYKVLYESSKLQYASNTTKLSISTQLMDRGLMTRNEAREIFNLSSVEDGDKYYIRKEYAEISKLGDDQSNGVKIVETTGEQTQKNPDNSEDGISL